MTAQRKTTKMSKNPDLESALRDVETELEKILVKDKWILFTALFDFYMGINSALKYKAEDCIRRIFIGAPFPSYEEMNFGHKFKELYDNVIQLYEENGHRAEAHKMASYFITDKKLTDYLKDSCEDAT